ncbi:phosphoribosylglycinamide formyltransferase [Listeria costaricensis]|uniref:phosphoribosylglycinamide formyltransferase n=1 Tax=Listeria costaricensis TaxID=2026604 RepID=UPI000C06AA22|nr:phosphoribosylglycinamide formyltransferase [Listeria costaricensis]
MNLAVFASGTGSNFQALVDDPAIFPAIKLLVCDKKTAPVIRRAEQAGIPVFVFTAKDYVDKASFEQEILDELARYSVDLCVLAGYMRLIGPTLLGTFQNRIVNLHPSLLPAFPGKDAIGQAYQARVEETGVTAHFVDSGMDTGPVIAQEKVVIAQEDTIETLTEKIHQVEHRFYPAVVKQLMASGKEVE